MQKADIRDRDGAPRAIIEIRSLYPWLRRVFADGDQARDKFRAELQGKGGWTLERLSQ
jgi:putative transposase